MLNTSLARYSLLANLVGFATAGCGSSALVDADAGSVALSGPTAAAGDAGPASVPPVLKAGVDPSIFLPQVVAGYHPTAEELATSGKACASDADCATSGGQVVFHCSTPYYGQAQCQGAFPPGDQVVPGIAPSCVYYDCPLGYQCETEAETHSVTCLAGQNNQTGKPAAGQDAGTQSGKGGAKGGGQGGGA